MRRALIRSISSAVVFVALSSDAGAQESLRLDEAVRKSLAAHPSIGVASAAVSGADAALDEAEAARRPRVAVSGSLFQYEEPMVVTPIHGFGADQFPEFDDTLIQNALNVELLLWDGGATPARIASRKAQSRAAEFSESAARDGLMLRTSAVYLAALARRSLVESHGARIVALQSEERRVRLLLDVGRAADVDLMRVEAALASAVAERQDVAFQLDAALRELARIIAEPEPLPLIDVVLEDSLPSDRPTLESIALDNNPVVRRARELTLSREAERAAARAVYRPQVHAGGSWLQFGDDSLSFDNEWNVGVRIRVPVWDGGATAARVAQATAAVRAAEEEVRIEEHRLLDRLDLTIAAAERASANIESLQIAVDRFEEVVRVERLRLDTGVGMETDYLQAEADLLQARSRLTTARYQYILSRIELAHVLGELTPQWFSTNLRSLS